MHFCCAVSEHQAAECELGGEPSERWFFSTRDHRGRFFAPWSFALQRHQTSIFFWLKEKKNEVYHKLFWLDNWGADAALLCVVIVGVDA